MEKISYLPNINFLLDIGAACAQMHFVQRQCFVVPKHMFCISFIDFRIDVGIDDSGSTFLMPSHNMNLNLTRYARMCESFTVALIMLRRNRNTTPALSPIRTNAT